MMDVGRTEDRVPAATRASTSVSRPRRSSPVMTKYELAAIIGMRAEQIARGAPPLVDEGIDDVPFDPVAIARRELRAGRLPFVNVRKLPDGSKERWKLKDLEIAE